MIGGGVHKHSTHIVKSGRNRQPEPFDREKLHKSLVAACLSTGVPIGHAESISRKVVDAVDGWAEPRPEVTSRDIRRIAAQFLKTYHPDASYLYEHHRSTL